MEIIEYSGKAVDRSETFVNKSGNLINAYARRDFVFDVKSSSVHEDKTTGLKTFEAIISTPRVDRYGEIVSPLGMEMEDETVILLFNHDSDLPIGRSLYKPKITDSADGIFAKFRVDDDETRIWGKIVSGTLKKVSIGFIPKEIIRNEEGIIVHIRWELCEVSVVSVEANIEAEIRQIANEKTSKEGAKLANRILKSIKYRNMENEIKELKETLINGFTELKTAIEAMKDKPVEKAAELAPAPVVEEKKAEEVIEPTAEDVKKIFDEAYQRNKRIILEGATA